MNPTTMNWDEMDWFCEEHPELPWPHDDCAGPGILENARIEALAFQRDQARKAKDQAYEERNRLVALLAEFYRSGIAKTAIEGWDEAWHNCVFIDLPTGQASWHYHDDHAHLFEHLPPYDGSWDGHTTEEKYERIARLTNSTERDPELPDTSIWAYR